MEKDGDKDIEPILEQHNVICCGFFHEATQTDINTLIADNRTWGDIMLQYKQPVWCNYINALDGQMGCWSLTDLSVNGLRNKISESFCQSCSEFKKSV